MLEAKTASPSIKTFAFKDKACAQAKPGQFLMVWIPGIDEIPLSVLNVTTKGVVTVAVRNVGKATNALHRKKAGDLLGVRGPFGNCFSQNGRNVLLVGGGTGVAPLLFLARRMNEKDFHVTFVLGAKTQDELLFIDELKRFPARKFRLVVSTEDGSCGITGLCTQPVEELLAEGFDSVYACGPEKMILRVFELTEEHGIPLQASLERLMRCAIGLCGSCLLGKYRVCRDGPVFNSKQLREVKGEFGFSKRDQSGRRIPID